MSPAGVVHLACGAIAAVGHDWVSASERQRLAGLRGEARRAQFLAARWQARWLLAQVHGGAPQDWVLEAPADAPPTVAGRPDLFLSVSHSGTLTACAVAEAPVGLDLEEPRRPRDIAGLVALCCTPREQRMFATPDAALFHDLWTVKEAWLKQRGEWVAPRRLAQVEATRDPGGAVRTWRGEGWHLAVTARAVRWWTPGPAMAGAWSVRDLASPPRD